MRLLVFDTETGGLDPSKNGLTQVCAGVCDFSPDWKEYDVVDIYHTMIKPIPGLIYDEKALEIQGTTLAELDEKGVRIGHAFQGLAQLVDSNFGHSKAATPYGVNVKFDIDFMDANAKRYGLNMPFNFVYRDVCQWFRLLQDLGVHTRYRANLDTILTHYGIDIVESDRHTARGDVIATAEAIRSMMSEFSKILVTI